MDSSSCTTYTRLELTPFFLGCHKPYALRMLWAPRDPGRLTHKIRGETKLLKLDLSDEFAFL